MNVKLFLLPASISAISGELKPNQAITRFPIQWSWINKGVAPCYASAFPSLTLKDEKGGIVSVLTDGSLDMHSLSVSSLGNTPVKELVCEFAMGAVGPTTKPGDDEVFVAAGSRDGTPTIALPMGADDGQHRDRLGKETLTVPAAK